MTPEKLKSVVLDCIRAGFQAVDGNDERATFIVNGKWFVQKWGSDSLQAVADLMEEALRVVSAAEVREVNSRLVEAEADNHRLRNQLVRMRTRLEL